MKKGFLAFGTAAIIAFAFCSTALGAASNPQVTRGSGNTLVLTFTESTATYGIKWYIAGHAYAITSISPSGTCSEWSQDSGIICTWVPSHPAGTVTVSMTTDKFVSPNTQTHLEVDSKGAEDQMFQVLVGGGVTPGPSPTPTPAPSPTPTPDPVKQQKKDAAKDDLEAATGNAVANCSVALSGAGLIGAGVFSGPNVAAGLSATVAGTFMVDTAGPLCGLALARIKLDFDLINDPPDPRFAKVALPKRVKAAKKLSCRKAGRRGARACGRLAKAGAALATAARRTQAIRTAMDVTMNRTTSAATAGDSAGVALQDASHRVLAGMLAKAIKRQNKAAATFARTLRRYGIGIKLDAKLAERGIEKMLKRLAAKGVPEAQLRALVGSRLDPKPVDVVKQLSRPSPTSELKRLARALSRPAASKYLKVAAKQMHTSVKKARKRLKAAGAYLPR